jgi:hypothetical protein
MRVGQAEDTPGIDGTGEVFTDLPLDRTPLTPPKELPCRNMSRKTWRPSAPTKK